LGPAFNVACIGLESKEMPEEIEQGGNFQPVKGNFLSTQESVTVAQEFATLKLEIRTFPV